MRYRARDAERADDDWTDGILRPKPSRPLTEEQAQRLRERLPSEGSFYTRGKPDGRGNDSRRD